MRGSSCNINLKDSSFKVSNVALLSQYISKFEYVCVNLVINCVVI